MSRIATHEVSKLGPYFASKPITGKYFAHQEIVPYKLADKLAE